MKNLHQKVTEKDLNALFGQFQGNGEDPVLIRLMKGKMKGQAFIEFPSELSIYFTVCVFGEVSWDIPVHLYTHCTPVYLGASFDVPMRFIITIWST